MSNTLLELRDLVVQFPGGRGPSYGTAGVSITIDRNERVGLVGESGSGKSVTALAMLGMVPPGGRILRGSVRWLGMDMLDPAVAREVRGRGISIVFQDPMSSLSPVKPVGQHIREILEARLGYTRDRATKRTIELLEHVGIARAEERSAQFAHEFSGGMQQRVMIAAALASDPQLLIADEPTTALDVTVQAQILDLLHELSEDLGFSVLLISHDLAVVGEFCQRIEVMYAGRIVEMARVEELFTQPSHPYSQALLALTPHVDRDDPFRTPITGEAALPDPSVQGCPFAPRCPEARELCRNVLPQPLSLAADSAHYVACWNRSGNP
jgi:oligopeptide/dipeptide ABC transporter ATP-binding protein